MGDKPYFPARSWDQPYLIEDMVKAIKEHPGQTGVLIQEFFSRNDPQTDCEEKLLWNPYKMNSQKTQWVMAIRIASGLSPI